LSTSLRAQATKQYHATFRKQGGVLPFLRRSPLPAGHEGVYEHPAYGSMELCNKHGSAALLTGGQWLQLRPGAELPWAIDAKTRNVAYPCFFSYEEGDGQENAGVRGAADSAGPKLTQSRPARRPTALNAFMDINMKTPIRFEKVRDSPAASPADAQQSQPSNRDTP
jgi:hypothetical protein